MLIDGIKRSPVEQAMRNVVDLLFALYGYLPLHPFIPLPDSPRPASLSGPWWRMNSASSPPPSVLTASLVPWVAYAPSICPLAVILHWSYE